MSRPPAPGAGRRPLGARSPGLTRLRALLRDPRRRRAEGVVVLEGARLIDGALSRGARIRALYLTGGEEGTAGTAPLEARAAAQGAEVFEVATGALERVATTVTPQPVLALFDGPDAGPPDPWPPPTSPVPGPLLVLAGVSDPGNLGTLVRSAEAAGVTTVVRGAGTADPSNPKSLRASAGAVFGVTIVDAPDTPGTLDALRRAGWTTIGTVPSGGRAVEAVALTGAVALVVGSEAHGLGPAVTDRLDERVSIPMEAGESLNAAVAGSIVLFEAARQRRAGASGGNRRSSAGGDP